MTSVSPSWAIPKESSYLPRHEASPQTDYSAMIRAMAPFVLASVSPESVLEGPVEVMRAIKAYPDVVVFPIWVAGPSRGVATRNLANKIAQVAGAGHIAVIYPDIGEPYRSVFTQIIEGIESKAKGRVANFAVGPNVDVAALNNSLRRQDTKVVIALGRQGAKASYALDADIGVVVGGVLSASE
ncbi:MAG: hypothetical protein WC825_12275, partial [Gallionellaceae bacterium]